MSQDSSFEREPEDGFRTDYFIFKNSSTSQLLKKQGGDTVTSDTQLLKLMNKRSGQLGSQLPPTPLKKLTSGYDSYLHDKVGVQKNRDVSENIEQVVI